MAVHLDHLMVPSRNKVASAKLLAELLGVRWSETGVEPFAPVYVNDGLTLGFDEWPEPIPMIHYCFRVGDGDFDAILGRIRAAGIPYRGSVHGPVDLQVDTRHGGRIVHWNEPDGHQWEMLTGAMAIWRSSVRTGLSRGSAVITVQCLNMDRVRRTGQRPRVRRRLREAGTVHPGVVKDVAATLVTDREAGLRARGGPEPLEVANASVAD